MTDSEGPGLPNRVSMHTNRECSEQYSLVGIQQEHPHTLHRDLSVHRENMNVRFLYPQLGLHQVTGDLV